MKTETITVEKFFNAHGTELKMKLLAGGKGMNRLIREPSVNRPGLVLAGFTPYFAYKRIQALGNADVYYLKAQTPRHRESCYRKLFQFRVPCLVFSRNLRPDDELLRAADRAGVPVFSTSLLTLRFINVATMALDTMFAPHGTELGSMVDILGVGVIIKGESGIGKSESVLALIERGYSLVADDVTRVTLLEGHEIIGTCSDLTRGHMEVRGIGIINVAAMFGVKSIRSNKRVDLVVSLKSWQDVPDVDRLGMEQQFTDILGIQIPHIIIPVKPGRDIARLIEVAALHTKLTLTGYNPARELNERLIATMKQNAEPRI
jgi:HPr kinase/phosphorylase